MMRFVGEVSDYLETRCLRCDEKVRVGGYYWDGDIMNIVSIEGDKVKFKLFRLDEEIISPYWSGEGGADSFENRVSEISKDVYEDVKIRYNRFVSNLKKRVM